MNCKAVVFDMDGVIFDSEREVMNCWITLAKKYGIKDIEENFLLCTGTNHAKTAQIMHDAYGSDFQYEEFAHEASKMFHMKNDGGKLPKKPGVEELLRFLKSRNIKIALASSMLQPHFHRLRKHLKLSSGTSIRNSLSLFADGIPDDITGNQNYVIDVTVFINLCIASNPIKQKSGYGF